jgi:2-polyprenyl-3-methyl-5-hydroxy-6-metoxy-1,4-benzoquinol methylase
LSLQVAFWVNTACPATNFLYNIDMNSEIAHRLLKLNHQFYQTFAHEFSNTRQRLQPGVVKVVGAIPHTARLLDLGCGNGMLANYIMKQGHTGPYIGIDMAEELIQIAQKTKIPNAQFIHGDLADPNWEATIPQGPFDYIFCFAVLHHIPGENLRLKFFKKVHNLLAPDGCFVQSNWQFLNSEKLRERIQPWNLVGLDEKDVDENDYLLDWRLGGEGLRYVHFYTSKELHSLATDSGFKVCGMFTSDGETGNLGLYQIWEKAG